VQCSISVVNLHCSLLLRWWNTFKIKTGLQAEDKENGRIKKQWIEDYKLLGWGPNGLFPEYLEMGECPFLFTFVHVFLYADYW